MRLADRARDPLAFSRCYQRELEDVRGLGQLLAQALAPPSRSNRLTLSPATLETNQWLLPGSQPAASSQQPASRRASKQTGPAGKLARAEWSRFGEEILFSLPSRPRVTSIGAGVCERAQLSQRFQRTPDHLDGWSVGNSVGWLTCLFPRLSRIAFAASFSPAWLPFAPARVAISNWLSLSATPLLAHLHAINLRERQCR